MINVGEVYQDKTTNKHYEVLNFFAGQIKISDGKNQYYISEEHFNLIFESPDYKKMYEQQKQRADELEDVIKRYHDEALREIKRADELENTLAYIKSHLDDLWHNGDATEHEYAYNTLKYIESLQEDDND